MSQKKISKFKPDESNGSRWILKQEECNLKGMETKIPEATKKKLLKWFESKKRSFPWRETKDPYSIWVSEVMLQQTTAKAVVPYYKRFLKAFPDIQSLARAEEEAVYPLWAGLGYYQRAKNLIKASKEITKKGGVFPPSASALIKLPGFGPYTARAVSSLAFEEPVGVVDGNVIRFLSRFLSLNIKWWKVEGRRHFQALADKWVEGQKPSLMNQALMEIGSLICLSASPACRLCPLVTDCSAFSSGIQDRFPLKRQKKPEEMLSWKPFVIEKRGRFAFVQNRTLPFLKGRLVFPGHLKQIKTPPPDCHFQHNITHYKIYVTVQAASFKKAGKKMDLKTKKGTAFKNKILKQMEVKGSLIWLDGEMIKRKNPSSLIQKTIHTVHEIT